MDEDGREEDLGTRSAGSIVREFARAALAFLALPLALVLVPGVLAWWKGGLDVGVRSYFEVVGVIFGLALVVAAGLCALVVPVVRGLGLALCRINRRIVDRDAKGVGSGPWTKEIAPWLDDAL